MEAGFFKRNQILIEPVFVNNWGIRSWGFKMLILPKFSKPGAPPLRLLRSSSGLYRQSIGLLCLLFTFFELRLLSSRSPFTRK
jgi:hypothetical protein